MKCSDLPLPLVNQKKKPKRGYRVHHVEPDAPGARAGLVPILDYIIVVNGVRLDSFFPDPITDSQETDMRLGCSTRSHWRPKRQL